MNKLETSFFLEKKLKEAKCSKELKSEILKYIEYRHNMATVYKSSDLNIKYRMDLQYLLESLGVNDKVLKEAMHEINIDICEKIKKGRNLLNNLMIIA